MKMISVTINLKLNFYLYTSNNGFILSIIIVEDLYWLLLMIDRGGDEDEGEDWKYGCF